MDLVDLILNLVYLMVADILAELAGITTHRARLRLSMSSLPSNTPNPARGVYAALITPRSARSTKGNADTLSNYVSIIAASGVDGLVVFGTSGEFIHFDVAERNRLLSYVTSKCRLPVIVNVSHSSLAGAIELAEKAVQLGTAGVLLMPPYFFHYSDDQVIAFYREFAKAMRGAVPIYLYNMPFFTHRMSASLMERLFSTGDFAGVKDSSGDWRLFKSIMRIRAQTPLQNLTGNDRLHVRARTAGADGIISGVAGAIPELVVALDRAVSCRDKKQTKLLDGHLQQLLKYLSKFPAPVATRHAAIARGWKLDHEALTFDANTRTELAKFRSWFQQWLPAVLADARSRA